MCSTLKSHLFFFFFSLGRLSRPNSKFVVFLCCLCAQASLRLDQQSCLVRKLLFNELNWLAQRFDSRAVRLGGRKRRPSQNPGIPSCCPHSSQAWVLTVCSNSKWWLWNYLLKCHQLELLCVKGSGILNPSALPHFVFCVVQTQCSNFKCFPWVFRLEALAEYRLL